MRCALRQFLRLSFLPTVVVLLAPLCAADDANIARDQADGRQATLSQLKVLGAEQSRFKTLPAEDALAEVSADIPKADLATYRATVWPLLKQHCVDCHGPDLSEGNVRVDALDPNLLSGKDADWWAEVFAVVTKGEMPPADADELSDQDRRKITDWLANELHTASIVSRQSGKRSSFRRLTRYEYNYALQDLLGLPWDFAKDLPPEAHSADGFENSANLLHLSVSQFETYYRIAREALDNATVTGDKPPTLYWSIPIKDVAAREWTKQNEQLEKVSKDLKGSPAELAAKQEELQKSFHQPPGGAYYKRLSSGRTAKAEWSYSRARYALAPSNEPVGSIEQQDCVAILPNGFGPRLIFELGNQLPDEGIMRVRVRASRVNTAGDRFPSLRLMFGWQASNEGRSLLPVSKQDVPIHATPAQPTTVQWDVPLSEIYPRNSVRKTSKMGQIPSPSEYVRFFNTSVSPSQVQIDHVQVAAPVFDQWPPAAHRRIFFDSDQMSDESAYAREVISTFMARAWCRPITEEELERKLTLFAQMRPRCDTFEQAVVEVLASVLSSPQFLFIASGLGDRDVPVNDDTQANAKTPDTVDTPSRRPLDAYGLASRLSLFLWCSVPDQELLTLAQNGQLTDDAVLTAQVERMLDDPRSERFAEQFVHQWLDMQLLDFLSTKERSRGLDQPLKEAMQQEPIALFRQMVADNGGILDFIHCDYAMVNERLAHHYGIPRVHGNHFRRVSLDDGFRRGGLLTQAGLLAMNSDWPDSHPLKRAIWLLECIMSDPPPPPPPAVPQINLADPEIAKMTLKERIEDHRNHAACMSCHVKIDPWGIAFENYDALGRWRDKIKGKPVDASSELFNQQTLDGMGGLKRFLLKNRQDQIVRSIVGKLTTFALGRPLTFADRADLDAIAAKVRREGDGLRTAIAAIVRSDLFRSE